MPRLGELLVATKLLTPEQLEQALRAQVMWGGRLGTNIIELGFLDLDQLSEALGKQHRLPAALARHFDKADPGLQRRLSPEFADRYGAVPLMQVASGKVIVAALGVVDARGVGIIAEELQTTPLDLVVSVAAELRIRYHLERVFGLPRGARFLRSRGKTIPPFPAFVTEELNFEDSAVSSPIPIDQRSALAEMHAAALAKEDAAQPTAAPAVPQEPVDDATTTPVVAPPVEAPPVEAPPVETPPVEASPVEAPPVEAPPVEESPTRASQPAMDLTLEALGASQDDLAIAQEPADERSLRDRRTYVRMITDEAPLSTESERQKQLGRIAIRKIAATPPAVPTVAATLGEATRAIRRSTDRDKVADLVMRTLEKFIPDCEAGVMLVLRGEVAIGWKGFCRRNGLPEIAIPLDQPGLIPRAIHGQCTVRAPARELGSIDQLFVHSLGFVGDRDLIVVPVMIAGQAMLTIALITPLDTEIQSAESIAAATGAAFARLMRDASR